MYIRLELSCNSMEPPKFKSPQINTKRRDSCTIFIKKIWLKTIKNKKKLLHNV